MSYSLTDKLVVGISSRALFDLDDENEVYESQGLDAYRRHQREHEDEPLEPGTAFPLVTRLLNINERANERLVEVVIISHNDADSGLRIMNSAEHHGLDIPRWAFTDGRPAWPYLEAFACNLFLSANAADVANAVERRVPAARLLPVPDAGTSGYAEDAVSQEVRDEVRIAFDGDAVLFSGDSERIYQEHGLEAFVDNERRNADVELEPGPLKPFLDALLAVNRRFPHDERPIRVSLVTARNAPAHRRVITTLRGWGVQLNETFFLGGLDKSSALSVLQPHIYFDDQATHLELARNRTPSGQVPSTVPTAGAIAVEPSVQRDEPDDASRSDDVTIVAEAEDAPSTTTRATDVPEGASFGLLRAAAAVEEEPPSEDASTSEDAAPSGGAPTQPGDDAVASSDLAAETRNGDAGDDEAGGKRRRGLFGRRRADKDATSNGDADVDEPAGSEHVKIVVPPPPPGSAGA